MLLIPTHGRTDVKFPDGNGRHHDGEQCGKCCNVSGFTCGFYQYACDPGVCQHLPPERRSYAPTIWERGVREAQTKTARQIFLHRDRDFFNDHGRRTDLLPTVVTSDFWGCGACGYGGFHYLFPDHGIFLSVYCPV